MKTIFKRLHSSLLIALAFLSVAGISYVFAAPTQPPSSGTGVDLPLHIGATGQTKAGALTVNGLLTAAGNLNVGGTLSVPTICLNGSCSSSWPAASITPGSASGSTSYYFGSYSSYNNGTYYYTVSGNLTMSGSGSLINAALSGSCPCIYSYSYGYNVCPTSSAVATTITNFSARTISFTGTCGYNGYVQGNGNLSFTGITI